VAYMNVVNHTNESSDMLLRTYMVLLYCSQPTW